MAGMDKAGPVRKRYRRGESVASIARAEGVSRDTACKYARTGDLSPKAPKPAPRRPPETGGWAPLVDQWLADDPGENRKQRHTARRVWARLVEECGAEAPGQTAGRHARDARPEIGSGARRSWARALGENVRKGGITPNPQPEGYQRQLDGTLPR